MLTSVKNNRFNIHHDKDFYAYGIGQMKYGNNGRIRADEFQYNSTGRLKMIGYEKSIPNQFEPLPIINKVRNVPHQ